MDMPLLLYASALMVNALANSDNVPSTFTGEGQGGGYFHLSSVCALAVG